MKKTHLALGGVVAAAAAAAVIYHFSGPKAEPEASLSLTERIEKSLQQPNPTREELEREVAMLTEAARQANEISPEDSPPAKSSVTGLLTTGKPVADPGYDLAALEKRFVDALQNTSVEERRKALTEIAQFLAGKDRDTATRFMKAIIGTRDQQTDTDGYTFATAFVAELVKSDAAGAAAWTEMLPEQLRYPATQVVALNWVKQDPAAVDSWSVKLTDSGLRASVLRLMSQSLGASDPGKFAPGWAKRLAENGDDGSRLSDLVVTHWGKEDFDAALAWADKLPDPDDRARGLVALANARAAVDPPAAVEWARTTLTGDVRAKAIQESMIRWVAKDPGAAAAWVDKLAEPAITDATFDMIAIAWMKRDEARAQTWIDAAAVNDDRRDYIYTVARQ